MSIIQDKGAGVFRIDPKAAPVEDYKKIVGFKLTIVGLEAGNLGGQMSLSALMLARGDHSGDDFAFDYSGGFPEFVGPAQELVTFSDSYLAEMFFTNPAALHFSSTPTTVTFEGSHALFTDGVDSLTACSIFGRFDLTAVDWIIGEPTEGESAEDLYSAEDEFYQHTATRRFNDIPTVESGTDANYVDIEVPVHGEGPYPVILWIHGGRWTSLNRKSAFIGRTLNNLAARGYAIVYAEYTLSKERENGEVDGSYPQNIYDLKAAVRFIRANAHEYNLDARYVAAMGESAGGHLAMLLGTTNGQPDWENLDMGHAEYSSRIQTMVSYFGPSHISGLFAHYLLGTDKSDLALGKAASPYYQLTAESPPLFLVHGEDDQAVSVMESHATEAKAKALMGEERVLSLYFDHGPHASKRVFDAKPVMEAVESFLTQSYAELIAQSNP